MGRSRPVRLATPGGLNDPGQPAVQGCLSGTGAGRGQDAGKLAVWAAMALLPVPAVAPGRPRRLAP
jgi:hypothetical protein